MAKQAVMIATRRGRIRVRAWNTSSTVVPKSVRLTRWYGQAVVPKVQPQTPSNKADTGRPVKTGWLDMRA